MKQKQLMEQILEQLSEDLHELKGSELKAIIAIYTEGRYLNSRDMMDLTGMARKTCLEVMESPHVLAAVKRVQSEPHKFVGKKFINQLRSELMKIEEQYGPGKKEN